MIYKKVIGISILLLINCIFIIQIEKEHERKTPTLNVTEKQLINNQTEQIKQIQKQLNNTIISLNKSEEKVKLQYKQIKIIHNQTKECNQRCLTFQEQYYKLNEIKRLCNVQ